MKILQIMPSQDWYYGIGYLDQKREEYHCIVCFALLEDKKGKIFIKAMVDRGGEIGFTDDMCGKDGCMLGLEYIPNFTENPSEGIFLA